MEDNFLIRELNFKDIKAVSNLVKNVFIKFESENYNNFEVENFIDFIKEENLLKNLTNGTMKFIGCYHVEKVIGSYSEKKLVGIIATKNENHISLLFVHENFQKQGIATKLFNVVKEKYKGKYDFISVNSSHYARDVYHKLGFFDTDKEQMKDGIIFIPMKFYYKQIKGKIKIRKAKVEDIDTLVSLRIKQLKDEGNDEKDISENLKKFYYKNLKNESLILYVGEDDNKIIATGGILIYNLVPYFENETGIIANVVNMYTDIYYRRQNIASKILISAINEGKTKGIKVFRVSASKYGKFLYKSNGFLKKENSYELIIK